MHILADGNMPGLLVAALRERGHDVVWIREDAPGIGDREILERAQREAPVITTFDKDFGELAFRFGLPASSGIVLFRIAGPSPPDVTRRALAVIESRTDWSGHFAVVEHDRIRIRRLPEPANE